MNEFFLVVAPGFEALAATEFKAWFPDLEVKVEAGGLTVQAPTARGLSFNHILKIPTRVLLRLGEFNCRDFPKLFQKLSTWPWHEHLDPRAAMTVHVSVRASRMKIKSRIEETALKGWKAWQDKRKSGRAANPPPASLYIRLDNNIATLSLDTSGERLHKRGERTHVGLAPLRETLAAGLLALLEDVAGAKDVELVDPMMGSGVFLLEALTRDLPVEERDFARAIKTKADPAPSVRRARARYTKVIGLEFDDKTLAAAKSNLDGYDTQIVKGDIFKAKPLEAKAQERWLIANPPYGERIRIEGEPQEYYAKLFQACDDFAQPDFALFIVPRRVAELKPKLPKAWKVACKLNFSNGGIPVVALVFGRKSE